MERRELEAIRANAVSLSESGYPIIKVNAGDLIELVDMALAAPTAHITRTVMTTFELRRRLNISEATRVRYMRGMQPIGREGRWYLWTEEQAADVAKALERNKII